MSDNETPTPTDPDQPWGQQSDQARPVESPAWGQGYLGQHQPGAPVPPGPGYGGGAGYGGGGYGGGSGPGSTSGANYRGPKGVKTSRFAGMGMPLLTGLGLLGLLATVLIMVLLMGKVMDGVSPSSGAGTDGDSVQVLPGGQVLDPGSELQPETPAQPGNQNTEAAQAAMCDTNRLTLETAAQAYQALTGAPPANQQALVDEQYLKSEAPNFELTPNGDSFTITGTGPCA